MRRAVYARWLNIALVSLLVVPSVMYAQSSSESYTVENDSLNAGGTSSGSSTNYGIVDTAGEVSGGEALSSETYGILDGFLTGDGTLLINSVYMSSSANGMSDAYPAGTINDLSAGSTITRHINGVVEHEFGREAITGVSAVFYRSGVTGAEACVADDNDCLRVSSCTLANNSDVDQKTYNCPITLQYYIDATDSSSAYASQQWVVYVSMTDGSTTVFDESVTKEIGSLLSLDIPATIAFGGHALGDQTTAGNNVGYTLTQEGNTLADVEVSMADDMTCDVGSIPKGNVQWSLTDIAYSAVGTSALTGTASDTNVGVVRQSSSTPTTGALYWNLYTPTSGLGGNCSGATTLTTIAG